MSITYSDLARTIAEQSIRIAELEAEVELLKSPYAFFVMWQQDQLKKLEGIKQQSTTEFEEGGG